MKYIVCEGDIREQSNFNASNKPRRDVEQIATECGYKRLFVNTKNGVQKSKIKKPIQFLTYLNNRGKWKKQLGKLKQNDIVLIQYPLINTTLNFYNILKKYSDKITFIALIHDMDSLRWTKETASSSVIKRRKKEDKLILNNCKYIIAHNNKMKEELIKLGNKSDNIFELNLFDYIMDNDIEYTKHQKEDPIIIAGNLSKSKAKYLEELKDLSNVNFNLYGIGYEKNKEEKNIFYKGKYPAEDLVNHLEGSFGLVWDGNSKDTCSGGFGQYLKYNNPHKASLYLTAGIPIITWEDAAIAKFVKENNVGIVVKNLDEISDKLKSLTDEEYFNMTENAKEMSKKLMKGYFLNRILKDKIDEKINNQKLYL